MTKTSRLVSTILFLALVLSACNMPGSTQEPERQSAEVVLTAAAQTVEAKLTQAPVQNTQNTATPQVVLPTSTTAPPTVTLAVSPTTSNGGTVPTATSDCDDAEFVADVTIPDGTVLDPNETFTKTWRLRNSGTCSWTPAYAVLFSTGNSMNGPVTQALTGNVNPGQTMDISVNLKAPASAGDYIGYWKLRNASGNTFATFYVDINVGGDDGPFAVTSVNYSLSTWDDASHTNCPRVTASIKTNTAGTVTFVWKRQDTPNGGSTQTLEFTSAGTKTVDYDWARGSTWDGTDTWVGIYVDNPNHQDFGKIDFDTACTTP
ncbi:MAG: NBR1-Ig-like domain-containing protein [Anaerolineales bacterium]